MYIRECPSCSKPLEYRNPETVRLAEKRETVCRSCARVKVVLRQPPQPTIWIVPCPDCGKNRSYKQKWSATEAEQLKSRCISCAKKGQPGPTHTPEFCQKQRFRRLHVPFEELYGKEKSAEIKEKLSARIYSTEQREHLRKLYYKNHMDKINAGRIHTEETRRNARIRYIENMLQKGTYHPPYNKKACEYFNKLISESGTHIQHALNGGELHIKELGYWVDGYDKVNNIVYEFDEIRHHYKDGKLLEKDIKRQKQIEDFLGCTFIRIKETDV